MKIEKVYISCWKHDVNLVKICIASIRYWYPDIPIALVIDENSGRLNLNQLCDKWDVKIYENNTVLNRNGWNFLAPLFKLETERVLLLDADLVFIGPVLDLLNEFEQDFVINVEYKSNEVLYSEHFSRYYFDYRKLQQFDPSFVSGGYAFNSGQLVATTNKIDIHDVTQFLDLSKKNIEKRYPEIFPRSRDQGILNYLLPKYEADNKISIGKSSFMKWPKFETEKISLEQIRARKIEHPYILHWAGISEFKYISTMTYKNILRFYNDYYYSKLKYKSLVRIVDIINLHLINLERIWSRIPYLLKRKWDKYFKLTSSSNPHPNPPDKTLNR